MNKLLLSTMLLILLTVSAMAAPRIYGPFSVTNNPDSGTCGNWALDTFDRYFHVIPNPDGTFSVVEQFKRGTFITTAGASPGACESGSNNGNTVAAGLTGDFQGKVNILVTTGVYDPAVSGCYGTTPAYNCGTRVGFLKAAFGDQVVYNIPSWLFNYNAGPNGDWKNASTDKGGNAGDITGAP